MGYPPPLANGEGQLAYRYMASFVGDLELDNLFYLSDFYGHRYTHPFTYLLVPVCVLRACGCGCVGEVEERSGRKKWKREVEERSERSGRKKCIDGPTPLRYTQLDRCIERCVSWSLAGCVVVAESIQVAFWSRTPPAVMPHCSLIIPACKSRLSTDLVDGTGIYSSSSLCPVGK